MASFLEQLDAQAKLIGYVGWNHLGTKERNIVYRAHLDNERNRQLQRIAETLNELLIQAQTNRS
jgi:hypothetical protein